MKSKLLALILLAASPVLAGSHFSFGFGVGSPYYRGYRGGRGYYGRPPIVTYAPPVYGYGSSYGPSYYGQGYYGQSYYGPEYYNEYGVAPFAGAVWFAPRSYGGRYYRGHWGRRR